MLVTQPTAAPTRKTAAGAIAGLITVALVPLVTTTLPGLSEACATEVGVALAAGISALAVNAVQTATAYMTRERG